MSKVWDGKTYDEDWYEIDAGGNRTTGQKDWAANDAWNAQPTSDQTPGGITPVPATPAQPTSNINTDWQGLSDDVTKQVRKDATWNGLVDQSDPAYKQQVDANQLQTNLAADRARAAAVQRRAATGTGTSGAVDTDVNKVLEQQSYQDKTFEANLLDKFRQQGLDAQARGLQLGSGMLTAEQERQLRGALTREGYTLQKSLADQEMNYKRDALGQQLALSQAQMDQNAIMALLGG